MARVMREVAEVVHDVASRPVASVVPSCHGLRRCSVQGTPCLSAEYLCADSVSSPSAGSTKPIRDQAMKKHCG